MSGWRPVVLADVLVEARPGFACGEDVEDGVFQFRMNNITTDGRLDFTKQRRVPRNTRNIDTFLVECGDVLFNATNSPDLVGKTAYFPGMEELAVFSNHFLRLRPRANRLDGRFLSRWLNLQFERGRFKGMCRQWVNQATVSRDALLAMPLPLPPLPEQRRIAEILDKADALRAKRRGALAQLDTLTQSIFLDMFGDPATNPKGWRVEALGELVETASGGTPRRDVDEYFGGRIPWVKSGELHGGIVTATEEGLTDRGLAESSAKVMPAGTVLVAMYGATVGAVAVLGIEAATNQAVCCISPSDQLLANYLVFFLRWSAPALLAKRVGGAQPNLSQDLLRRLVVPVPPRELQEVFAERVAATAITKRAAFRSSDEMDALFASLQHRAFRGDLESGFDEVSEGAHDFGW